MLPLLQTHAIIQALAVAPGAVAAGAGADEGAPTPAPASAPRWIDATPHVAPARPRAGGERAPAPVTLYVNFDGAVLQSGCGNDPRRNCSTLAGLFDGVVEPFLGNDSQKLAVIQGVRRTFEELGVNVVVERPDDAVDYAMVIYGDLGPQDFAGVAPYVDCDDAWGGDTSFSDAFRSANTGATIVAHEAGHTWGLEHVDAEFDVMNPFKSATLTQRFVDDCLPIVASTELEPTTGICNHVHTRWCDATFQSSRQILLAQFGPAIPDVTPPVITLVEPRDGATIVAPSRVPLVVDVVDDRHPQAYRVELLQGDQPLYAADGVGAFASTFTVADLQRPPAGDYALRVRLFDEAGNVGEALARFRVVDEASGDTDATPAIPDYDVADCTCRSDRADAPGPGGLALGLAALGLARRRRRAVHEPSMRPRTATPRRVAVRHLVATLLGGGSLALLSGCPAPAPSPESLAPPPRPAAEVDADDPRVVAIGDDLYARNTAPRDGSNAGKIAGALSPPPERAPGSGKPDESNGVCRLFAPELPEPECCADDYGLAAEATAKTCGLSLYLGESWQQSCGYFFVQPDGTEAWLRLSYRPEATAAEAAASQLALVKRGNPATTAAPTPVPGVPGAMWLADGRYRWAYLPGWSKLRQLSWSESTCPAGDAAMFEVLRQVASAPPPPPGVRRRGMIPGAGMAAAPTGAGEKPPG